MLKIQKSLDWLLVTKYSAMPKFVLKFQQSTASNSTIQRNLESGQRKKGLTGKRDLPEKGIYRKKGFTGKRD
jgi:hypothetical protein